MNIINPATEELITQVDADNAETLALKFKRLQSAQSAWAAREVEERSAILLRFVDLLKQNIEPLAAILTAEMGKPLQQSRNEINGASGKATWLAEHAPTYLADELMSVSEQMTEKIVYEALGVICNISAWNYPYNVGVNVRNDDRDRNRAIST